MTDSRSIFGFFLVCAATMLAVVVGGFVVTNPSGGIVALVPIITTILSLVAIKNPRAGLFCLAALVIWVDEFKRLAVYYGGVNTMTIIQTLAMPLVVIAALNAGFLLGIMFGRVKLDRIGILIYISAALVGAGVFLTTKNDGFVTAAQRSANITGYLTLVPICYTYLRSFDDWRKFFSFQVIVALPAAAWAIKQYYFGFDQIEWMYARSGLSQTHYAQMIYFENPRVFGFFGSASSLSCTAIYCAFSWWHAVVQRKRRFLWGLIALIFTFVIVISTQRTTLLYPLLILPLVFCFRQRITTFAVYAVGAVIFVSGVFSAKYMLEEGLENINRAIALDNSWGEEVLRVSTYSDRLRGWERLTKAENYSLFGIGKETFSDGSSGINYQSESYSHDIINKILINYGIIGILVIAISGAIMAYALHQTIFRQQSKELRNNAAFALALSYPMILISFVGGDNFNANPVNIQIWTAIAGVFVCRIQSRAAVLENSHKQSGEN